MKTQNQTKMRRTKIPAKPKRTKFHNNVQRSSESNHQEEFSQNESDGSFPNETLYETATRLEKWHTFQFNNLTIDEKLELLGKEVKIQIKISAESIFCIGEILWKAKKVCQEDNNKFSEWRDKNCNFSHDTASNFMNVFKYCGGYRELVHKILPSILYTVGSPNFPEALREPLFLSGTLEGMKGKNIKALADRFKKGDEEEQDKIITEINKGKSIHRQTKYIFDMCENALKVLYELKVKIEKQGGSLIIEFEEKIKSYEPTAADISLDLFNSIKKAISDIENILKQSRIKLDKYEN
jgi:hypothetical protein